MGWDAFSSAKGSGFKIEDIEIKNAFESASISIVNSSGKVDGSLSRGGLGLSDSARMLSKAIDNTAVGEIDFFFHPYQDEEVTADQAKQLAMKLNWNFELDYDDMYAYWSAKEFIRVCAEFGLSIRFSF
jgi:hypothetical protein